MLQQHHETMKNKVGRGEKEAHVSIWGKKNYLRYNVPKREGLKWYEFSHLYHVSQLQNF